jgi:hypothetical protein
LAKLENYHRIDILATASVADKQVPITSATVTYAIDQIPKVSITIPVGRAGNGSSVTVGAHIFSSLAPFSSIKIHARAVSSKENQDAKQGGDLPSGQFLLFDGYVYTPSMQMGFGPSGGAELRIEGFGRLGGLSAATTLSAGVVISKPPSGTDLFMSFFGGDQKKGFLTFADQLMQRKGYKDIAGEILSLFKLAIQSTRAWKGKTAASGGLSGAAAVRALNNLSSGGKFNLLSGITGTSEVAFGRMIAETLSNTFCDIWTRMDPRGNFAASGGGDLWEVLTTLQGLFLFRIVPTVLTDYLAPITPGLGGTPYNTFNPNEYSLVEGGQAFSDPFTQRNMSTYITQVGLAASSFQSSAFNPGASVTGRVGFAEINQTSAKGTALDGGRLFLMHAPTWLIPAGQVGKNTLNPFKGISDALSTGGAFDDDMRLSEIQGFGSALGNNAAKSYLHELLFAHRNLTVKGRLRTDVAPGNLAKIVLPAEGFLGVSGDVLYGMVSSVKIDLITSEAGGTVQTEIGFSHIRTSQEHESFTVPNHPLYGEKWSGKPLI